MLFTINDLGFSIAGLLLEGWLAFAARCVCALALLFIGWVVSRWMQKNLFPRLLKRSWHFAFTHPLLESFARPAARIAWYTGMYLALRSLPWAIPGLAALLLKAYRMMLVFLIGTGFYHASGIAALLLASSSEEVRTNRTLLTLLDKVYKVAVVVLCGATIAQESGLPVGSVVASAGLIGLTISLAAQDMAKNFFSGVVILLDKPFSIGDWITVGDVEGEAGYTTLERTGVRPSLDVNGIWGGYTGEGTKTVIPSKASAKISMRLVPNQDYRKISELFEKHFRAIAPESVKVVVKSLHGGMPYVAPTDMPAYKAAEKAVEATFGKKPLPFYSGGSIPIISGFESILGIKSLLIGFGLAEDAIHSPNESYGLEQFDKGVETIPLFYKYFAESE